MMDSLRAGLEYLLSPVFGAFAPWAVIFALTMIKIVAIIAPLMICVAYLTYAERRVNRGNYLYHRQRKYHRPRRKRTKHRR